MRDIIFKAKCVDTGEWAEGDLLQYGGTSQIWVQTKDGKWNCIVDPETVCQYTGLQDKNRQRIWENDIVRTSRYGKDDGNGHNFTGFDSFSVRWDDGGFALYNKWRRFNLRSNLNEYEIIGNIFDNPDLLNHQN